MLIGLAAVAFRLLHGSWLAPGAAWAGFWFVLTAMPLILAPEYPCFPSGVWVILFITLCLGFGSAVGATLVPPSLASGICPNRLIRAKSFRIVMLISLAASLYSIQLLISPYGVALSSLTNPATLQTIASTLSLARYENTIEPVQLRLMLCYIYFCCLLGGYYFAHPSSSRRSKWYAFLPLLGSLLLTATTSAKAGLLLSGLLWLAAYLPNQILQHSVMSFTRTRLLIWGMIGGGALISLFVAAMFLRYGAESMTDTSSTLERLRLYFAAHLSVFSRWWDQYYEFSSPQFGRISFFGPAALLGLNARQGGVYGLLPEFPGGVMSLDSNIYTIYRGLLEDFTLPGLLLVTTLVGLCIGYSFHAIRRRHTRRPLPYVMLTAFYVVLGWSHVINPFGYTTLIVAISAYAATLIIVPSLFRKRNHHARIVT